MKSQIHPPWLQVAKDALRTAIKNENDLRAMGTEDAAIRVARSRAKGRVDALTAVLLAVEGDDKKLRSIVNESM